ncbi:unnamed protein product [Sympodiomycopsis kandeliae]
MSTPSHSRSYTVSATSSVRRHQGLRRAVTTARSYASAVPSSPAAESSQANKQGQERHDLFHQTKQSYVMHHALYQQADLDSVNVLNYQPKNFSDRIAYSLVKMMRATFDFATRYPGTKKFPMVQGREKDLVRRGPSNTQDKGKGKDEHEHLPEVMPLEQIRAKGLSFTPEQWLQRCIFLESVAGCPGLVAAMARHLHSLRLLRRDKGWIHTCLEDAENERMHLLSFMALAKPGRFMRLMLLGAQGVFFNALFVLYILHPRTVHRFVGVLEEEAVKTYTGLIKDVEEGRLPEWEQMAAPQIAKEYWKLPDDALMLDMIKVIRADEAGHRFIHHTLADLDQKNDTNPFSVAAPTPHMIGTKLHLSREESLAFIEAARKAAQEEIEAADVASKHPSTQGAAAAQSQTLS